MSEEERIRRARVTAEARYEFRKNLQAYFITNSAFVVLWFFTGWFSGFGLGIGITENVFFWPIFPIFFWGLVLWGQYNDVHRKGEWITREAEKILGEEEKA